jgi:hypothetical protein
MRVHVRIAKWRGGSVRPESEYDRRQATRTRRVVPGHGAERC